MKIRSRYCVVEGYETESLFSGLLFHVFHFLVGHFIAIHFHLHVTHHFHYRYGNSHRFGMFEVEFQLETVANFEFGMNPDYHDMKTAGFQFNFAIGRDVNVFDRAHFEDAIFLYVSMQLYFAGNITFGRYKLVRLSGVVDNGEKSSSVFGNAETWPGTRVFNFVAIGKNR